ncbi:MFS transporter [Alkaliphilus transvaalensis]|uniref:MFS transporter n=1 Tax=Alkaliphilus transvaalensis TaxID=114628 RepID=UPI00047DC507|nr:MFS transporter [Alkaliphilus transvaalensis]
MKKKLTPKLFIILFSGITSLSFTLIFTVSSIYYIEVIKLDPLQLILVGTLLESVYFLFKIPTGIIADVYSRRLSIIIGTVLIGVAFLFEGIIPLYLVVLLSQFLWGIGATFLSGTTEAWIADFIDDYQIEVRRSTTYFMVRDHQCSRRNSKCPTR